MPSPATNDFPDIRNQMVSLSDALQEVHQQVQAVRKKVDVKFTRITDYLEHILETQNILTNSIKSLIDAQTIVKKQMDEKQEETITNYKSLKAIVVAQTINANERETNA